MSMKIEPGTLVIKLIDPHSNSLETKNTITLIDNFRREAYSKEGNVAALSTANFEELFQKIAVANDPKSSQLIAGFRDDRLVASARVWMCMSDQDYYTEIGSGSSLQWSHGYPIVAFSRACAAPGETTLDYFVMRFVLLQFLYRLEIGGRMVVGQFAKNYGGQKFLKWLPSYGYAVDPLPGVRGLYDTSTDMYYRSALRMAQFPFALRKMKKEYVENAQGKHPRYKWVGNRPFGIAGDGDPVINWEEIEHLALTLSLAKDPRDVATFEDLLATAAGKRPSVFPPKPDQG